MKCIPVDERVLLARGVGVTTFGVVDGGGGALQRSASQQLTAWPAMSPSPPVLRYGSHVAVRHARLILSPVDDESNTFVFKATHTHTQSFYCSSGICPGLPG